MTESVQPTMQQDPPGVQGAGAPPSSGGNGLAITALVLGVVALLAAFVPFLGAVVALPLGFAAIVVGLIGRSRARRAGGGGLAVAGVVTGAAGIVIALIWGVLASLFFAGVESDLREAIESVPAPVEDAPAEAALPEPAPEPADVAQGTLWTEPVSGAFWYAGMRVELSEAELAVDEWGETSLTLRAMVENLTDDTLAYVDFSDMWLGWGEELTPATYDSELESVPAGGQNRGALVFAVGEDFPLDGAVLYAGSPAQQQATVPLGSVGELVDGAPVDPAITGTLTAAGLTLEVTGAELRPYDERYRQLDADALALLFTVDLVNDSDRVAYSINYDFRLELPDGRSASPGAEPSESLWQGESARGQLLSFEIDEPPAGQYVLIVEFEGQQGVLEFSL